MPRVGTMECDLLILGNGAIAQSLVLALGKSSFSITAVDTRPPNSSSKSTGERTVALALGTIRHLSRWGILLDNEEAGTIEKVQVSQERSPVRVLLEHHLLGPTAGLLGQVVPLELLLKRLHHQVQALNSPIQQLPWGPVSGFEWFPDRIRLRWTSGQSITARLLVLADGGHGQLQRLLSLERQAFDHNRFACTAQVGNLGHAPHTAYEHFRESGPLALLPRADGQHSLVWTLLPSAAASLQDANDSAFLRTLNAQLPPGVPPLQQVSQRAWYPLYLQILRAAPESRVVPLGNAAQTLHPLAGQGYNLGLRDVISLAALLQEAEAAGQDPGSRQLLADFQRIRRQDRWETIAFTEGMNQLFGIPSLRLGRELAFLALARSPGLQRRLAARLAGVALPRASRIPPLQESFHDLLL
ncbi:MAG: FAD-dependent monooxygenase [Acidithiobacillus sp.]|nr:FAD-dependent monooxygenase [Acidithiobacillus sp.]